MNEMIPVLRPQTYAELERFAIMAAKSSLVPKDYVGRPENIMLAVQMGSELGLAPMQAIQNISVIGNRPAVWGDAMLALVTSHSACEDVAERVEGEGEKMVAICVAKRKGRSPVERSFSVSDAKAAGLWGKSIWGQYAKRMLQMRARGFALRDAFPDVLRGIISAEEARDIPADQFRGTTIEGERPAPRDALAESVPAEAEPEPPKPTAEELRERVDRAIQAMARATSDFKLTAVEANSRKLLTDLMEPEHVELLALYNRELQHHAERLRAEREAAA